MQQICNPGIVVPHNEQKRKKFVLACLLPELKILNLQINDLSVSKFEGADFYKVQTEPAPNSADSLIL